MACSSTDASLTNVCSCSSPASLEERTVQLHGWEGEGQFWYGPTELTGGRTRPFPRLDPACALCAWTTNSGYPGGVSLALSTVVRDLGDCAVATIDVKGFCPGPAAIVVLVPAHRQQSIRPEFAFGLTAFARFLEGPKTTGSELAIHNHIEHVITTERHRSVAFALGSRDCSGEVSLAVSEHIERLAAALIEWLISRDSASGRSSRPESTRVPLSQMGEPSPRVGREARRMSCRMKRLHRDRASFR